MPTPIDDPAGYWDHYARGAIDTDWEAALKHAAATPARARPLNWAPRAVLV